MSLSGFKLPEAVGFGVLGATIGAEVCSMSGGDMAGHTGLGMVIGAMLFIVASQRQALSRRAAQTRTVKRDTRQPVIR